MSEDRGVPLDSLTPADLCTLHSAFEDDVKDVWDYETRLAYVGAQQNSGVVVHVSAEHE